MIEGPGQALLPVNGGGKMAIREDILDKINRYKFVREPVCDDSNLYTDLRFDSLSFIKLLLEIEEQYLVIFDLSEMETCLQVNNLIALIEKKVKERYDDKTAAVKPEKLG